MSEKIIYKGVAYYRYPDSDKWAERSYYSPSHSGRLKGKKRLHQEIWQDANECQVPDGLVVHHYDHNPLNNDPTNLVLISRKAHARYHMTPKQVDALVKHLPKAREAAKAWHSSDAGLEWHREHGKRTWEGRELATFKCQHKPCGKTFESLKRGESVRFCSNPCKTKARRASGVDNVERVCQGCGERFTCNKYDKTTCCSKKCGWTVRKLKA